MKLDSLYQLGLDKREIKIYRALLKLAGGVEE